MLKIREARRDIAMIGSLLALTFSSISLRSQAAGLETICIPPLKPSPARCAMNIYGIVTDQNGRPLAGVAVSDGSPPNAITNADGFYDLHELEWGTYTLGFSSGSRCEGRSDDVSVTPMSTLDGGTRHDAQLKCHEV